MKRLSVESMGEKVQGVRLRGDRCDSPSCWCHFGPRVVASTGTPYTVEEVVAAGASRLFRYKYIGRAA